MEIELGRRFYWLVVSDYLGGNLFRCSCDCGGSKDVTRNDLIRGHVKSCGCRRPVHGMTGTRVHKIWRRMMERCYNPNKQGYHNYGGRGIKVCDRWHYFSNFYEDMGDPPEGLTLDRENNDDDYKPENCRWATWKQQRLNTRKMYNAKGYVKIGNKYVAITTVDGKRVRIGSYDTPEEAHQAYIEYRESLNSS